MRHLLFIFVGVAFFSTIAHADPELVESAATMSPRQIAIKNIPTPKSNLGLLGDIVTDKEIEQLSILSSKAFEQSQKFSDLKDFLRDYKINVGSIAETQTRYFADKDDESKLVSVTFEHRATDTPGGDGIWNIKSILYMKDGVFAPLTPEEEQTIYEQTFPVFSEDGDFSTFPKAWKDSQVWKKFNSLFGKSMADLVTLPKRQATIHDVIFYSQKSKSAFQPQKLVFVSISFEHLPPDKRDMERGWGWLISDFSAKTYDLGKDNDLKPIPIPPRHSATNTHPQQPENAEGSPLPESQSIAGATSNNKEKRNGHLAAGATLKHSTSLRKTEGTPLQKIK